MQVLQHFLLTHMVNKVGWQCRSLEREFPEQPWHPDWGSPWKAGQTPPNPPSPSEEQKKKATYLWKEESTATTYQLKVTENKGGSLTDLSAITSHLFTL